MRITIHGAASAVLAIVTASFLGGCSPSGATPEGSAPPAKAAPPAASPARPAPEPSPASPGASSKGMQPPSGTAPMTVAARSGQGVPSIRFRRTEHDFGTLLEGQTVKTSFEFDNRGSAPLEITRIKTSCGCTVAEKPLEEIPAGESGHITVRFDTRRRIGKNHKEISVFTNDPERPMLKLRILCEVIRQFWVEPQRIQLGRLTPSRPVPPKKLKIHWLKDLDLQVTSVTASRPAIRIAQSPFEGEKDRGVEVTLTFGDLTPLLHGPRTATRRISEFLTIRTSNEDFAQTKVNVSGTVQPEISVRPSVLSYSVVSKKSKEIRRTLMLRSSGGFRLDPPQVESPLECLELEVRPIREHEQYQIVATLRPESAPTGRLHGEVTIRTNSKDLAEIKVPVFGTIKE